MTFVTPPPHQIKIISYSCFLKHENRACHQEELNKILKSFSSTPIQKLKLYQVFNIMHFIVFSPISLRDFGIPDNIEY